MANVILGPINPDTYLNFNWVIVFSTLYFDVITTAAASISSIFLFALLMIFLPQARPSVPFVQATLVTRGFYITCVALASIVVTYLAQKMYRNLSQKEKLSQIALLNDIRTLISGISENVNTLNSFSQGLTAAAEETTASGEEAASLIQTIDRNATINCENLTQVQNTIHLIVQAITEHSSMTSQAIQATNDMMKTF